MTNRFLKTTASIFSVMMAFSVVPTVKAEAAPHDLKNVFLPPTGKDTGSDFNEIEPYVTRGGYRIKLRGTYYLNGMLRLASNTYIDAKGATIICTKAGSKMASQQEYDKAKGKSSQGGYNAVRDITIDGGTWVGTKKFGSDSMVKNGQKTGPNVFNFIHAKNITIKNATIYNVPNAHLIEFCGVKNGVVQNCTLGCYKDAAGKLIKGYTSGDKKRAAIQLDACDSAENNPLAWPYDNTVCSGVQIKNNYVWFYTGVQAAEMSKRKTSDVKVTGNKFKCKNQFGWLGNTKKFKKSGNKSIKYKESPTKSAVKADAVNGLTTSLSLANDLVVKGNAGYSFADALDEVDGGGYAKVNVAHRSDEAVNETGYAYLYSHKGTHQCIYNAWFDGRFYNKADVFVKGVTLDDDFGRKQDIVIKNPVVYFPDDSYRYKSKNYYDTDTNRILDYVVYEYDEKNNVWFAEKAYNQCFSLDGNTDYAALKKIFTITPSEAKSMGIDENTDTDPSGAVDFT